MRLDVLPVGRARAEMLLLGRRVAAELAVEAIGPGSALSMADRMALATLALAVEAEAARRAGAEPFTVEALPLLAAALARIEIAQARVDAVPIHPDPPSAER